MQHRPDAPYVFISYASADRERVMTVVEALERAGVPVWIDRVGIGAGTNYGEEIAVAIKGSAAFILMTSAASLASRNVKQEVALAWEHERPYVPLLLESATIPIDLQYWLTAAQWTEVLDKPEREWLPVVLAALTPLGISPVLPAAEGIHLAGRERELAVLRDKLAAAKGGTGGLVLIGGEAGIGKTTLAEVVCGEAARQGCAVLEGHCFDLAETPPYGPWIDLFLRFPISSGDPPLPPAFAERGTVGAVPSQMALFAQIQDFLDALTIRHPAVVLLDDLHWSDPASLDLLRFLARSVATHPLLILVTYRSDELTRRHPLYQLLPQLAREAGAARLDLRSLDDDAVRALATERYHLPDAATARLATYLQSRAEGNALFVGELLRSLEEAGALRQEGEEWHLGDLAQTAIPALLRQVIDGRLGRLDDESQRLLAVAAVIGHEVPLAVWATVAEVDEDALLAVAEEGLEARLLVEGVSGEAVRFAHALIRESLFAGIPAIRRRRIHRRVGEALADERTPDPDAVAYHYQQAGDDRAASWLVTAGERAQAAYAWLTAAARYEAALALMEQTESDTEERGWLLYHLSRMLRYIDPTKARAYMDEAMALGEARGDRAFAALARLERGVPAAFAGDAVSALVDIEAGSAALVALTGSELARLAARLPDIDSGDDGRAAVVSIRARTGRFHAARELGEQLLAETAARGAETLVGGNDGYSSLGHTYAMLGMPDEATTMFACARDLYLRISHHALVAYVSFREVELVALPYHTEDREMRLRLTALTVEGLTRGSGALSATVSSQILRLPLLVLEGQWQEAEELALAGSAEQGMAFRRQVLRYLATLARLRGDDERAWWAIYEVLPARSATEVGTVLTFDNALVLQGVAAALCLDAGDVPTAKEWLDAHDHWLAWSGAVLGRSEGQALWAQYHRQAGDMEKAWEHAVRGLAHATEPRQPLALIAAHRLLGELNTESGQIDEAAHHLDASLSLATACEAPYERALTLLAMAEMRAAQGERTAVRTLLDEVRAICEPLGAKPALARAEALASSVEAD